jgi:hypothetical protein
MSPDASVLETIEQTMRNRISDLAVVGASRTRVGKGTKGE